MPDLPAHTCLYFGTFNPVHTGHLMIAQAVLRQFSNTDASIKTVTFIPAGSPPHRHHELDLLDAGHRLRMVQLATASNPSFRVSDVEIQRNERSYTVETLRQLMNQGKIQAPAPMIIGSDALASLATWREPDALIDLACFLQAPRPGVDWVDSIELNGRTIPLNTRRIDMPMLALSSSWVRDNLRNPAHPPDGLRYFLAEPVRRYIQDNRLYSDFNA